MFGYVNVNQGAAAAAKKKNCQKMLWEMKCEIRLSKHQPRKYQSPRLGVSLFALKINSVKSTFQKQHDILALFKTVHIAI